MKYKELCKQYEKIAESSIEELNKIVNLPQKEKNLIKQYIRFLIINKMEQAKEKFKEDQSSPITLKRTR